MSEFKPEYKRLLWERKGKDGEVLWLTLNNEKMFNSMTETLQLELLDALQRTAFDNSIRCVVLTGAGDKAFCSGGDIRIFSELDLIKGYDFLYERGARIQQLITYMEKPVIAAVNGLAYAGGTELILCCDIVYASANATFGLLEINLGLLPGWGGTVRLPRKVPVSRAKEMIMCGEIILAEEAKQLGLVNKVFSQESLYDEINKLTDNLMSKPPLAIRAAKNVINNSITCDSMDAALAIERGSIMWLSPSEDLQEGLKAFAERRPGVFKGR
ncbi:MAG: enoyl-CoA hydratase/isomerase family protein [Firmicutes bacterium]|nr:enoyl-CoA hydratase/isomerase family protein [Bacillota bacterium]